ncbi:MAG TPA: hypothetical protein VGM94_10720 [Galbitalea sp.]|jgi:uncharacterized repeat protein (TIGR01451 family)
MKSRLRIARIAIAGVAAVALMVAGIAGAEAAYAANTISLTASASTVASGTAVTYTLNVACSTTGGCGTSTVSFPTSALTGDGATTDFSSWVTNGTCPTMSTTGGQVSFNYTSIFGSSTGSGQCTFTVTPPDFKTLPGAQATVTPTFTSATGGTATASAVTLTSTATHNASYKTTVPTTVVPGGTMSISLFFQCAASGAKKGDVGVSPLSITANLPANFTYTGFTPTGGLTGTITPPTVGSNGGTITYSGSGSDCASPPLSATASGFTISVTGTATQGGVPDAAGTTICSTPSATWTYLDATTSNSSANAASCTTVNPINTNASKAVTSSTIANKGQYPFGATNPIYTYPGDWDASGIGTQWDIALFTTPTAAATAGVAYGVKDPMPCLGAGPVASIYASSAVGSTCANPAYVPTSVTATGFTPSAGATITLLYANNTTGTVAYAGGKWTIPSSPAVSEIDFPPFAEEGNNSAATMHLLVNGYASSAAVPGNELRNQATVTSYLSSDLTTTVSTIKTPSAVLLVADPTTTIVYPNISAPATTTNCVASFSFSPSAARRNVVQFAQGTSRAIYYDFLLPSGATLASPASSVFTLRADSNARTYTSAAITPTQTPNYNGTGRTLLEWVIPAGLAQFPGLYGLNSSAINVQLPAGCAGTYQNDITLGYGGPAGATCISSASSTSAPSPVNPPADDDLDGNGTPTAGNYCGFSAPLSVNPVLPRFNVDKSVKGDLDPTTVGGGGIGKVSPSGGSATYTVTFTNVGQSNLHDPVMYDILPRIGDTQAVSTTPRNSQFKASLTGVNTLPAKVAVFYSTSPNPCRPEVLPSDPGCTDDWSATPPSPLSSTTALKMTYTGTVGVSGSPFPQTFNVSYTVSTPSTSVGNVAWNTVGTNVHTGDTGDPSLTTDLLAPAESSRTGLTASSSVPAITKSADTTTFDHVGQVVTYTFGVTNNAGVALTGVGVADAFTDAPAGASAPTVDCQDLTGPAGACSGATTSLDPGQSATFTATYTVTQADLDHGALTDVATATGTSAGGGTISNTSNAVTVSADGTAAIGLVKTASIGTVSAVDDTVTYHFAVTNTGNLTLHGILVNDPMLASVSCDDTILAPGDSTTCSAPYTVTQGDLDAGSIHNTATATGIDPANQAATSAPSSVTVTAIQTPGLTLAKSATPTTVSNVGDVVNFSFLVTNTGNVTVTGIDIDDTMLPSVTCPSGDLTPGADVTCTGSYTVVQADIDNGAITNTAEATGTTTGASPASVLSPPSTAAVSVAQDSSLSLVKSANVANVNVRGQIITYSFTITNTGNVTETDVNVDEGAFTGSGAAPSVDCPAGITSVAPGATVTCTATYTVTQADIDAGSITNSATATGLGAGNAPVASAVSSVSVPVVQSPALTLTKSASPTSAGEVGDVITFSFHIVNSGNVTVSDVGVNDAMLASVACPSSDLTPGDIETCTGSYTVVQADVDNGSITNTATASGETVAATPVSVISPPSTAAVSIVQNAALQLTKTADVSKVTASGQHIGYKFTIVNTGNVTATDIGVQEGTFTGSGTAPTVACPAGATSLRPGDTVICTATYTVVAGDLKHSSIDNTAVATGVVTSGSVLSDPSTADVAVKVLSVPIVTAVLGYTGLSDGRGGIVLAIILLALGAAAVILIARRRRRGEA